MVGDSMDKVLENSILDTVKAGLGVADDDDAFNGDLIPHINAALNDILQAGAGKPTFVLDASAKWGDFIDPEVDPLRAGALSSIILYVITKTRILFDPPSAGTMAVLRTIVDEQIWRVQIAYDTGNRQDLES